MNALEAAAKLDILTKCVKALDAAYTEIWKVFENRWMALELKVILIEAERERDELCDKLSSLNL